jgi:hypothetical protein
MSERNPVLVEFSFTDHDAWERYHSDDVDAFLESKTVKELFQICRDRGIRDSEVYACGHRTHKKTYVTALREAYMISKIVELSSGQTVRRQSKEQRQANTKVREDARLVANELADVLNDNNEFKKTNSALYNKCKRLEKEVSSLKMKLQKSEMSVSNRVSTKLQVANQDIAAFGAKMVSYERKIMSYKKSENVLRKLLKDERAKVSNSLLSSERCKGDLLKLGGRYDFLANKYEKMKKFYIGQRDALTNIAAVSAAFVVGSKRQRSN